MREYDLRTNSAHLDFIPGSATGPGMTFSKLFPFTVLVFPLALPLSALPKPSDALPKPKKTLSSQHSPQKGEQRAAALSIPGSSKCSLETPLTEPPPHWAIPWLIFPVCVQRPEYRNQLPAASSPQTLPWGKSAPHRSFALECPWINRPHSLSLLVGDHCGGEVLRGEA